MKTNQNGFAALAVVLIVLALAGTGAFFYVTQSAKQKNEAGGAASWQTYSNTEWGIEIQYPSNWNLKGNEMHNPASSAYLGISRLENPKNLSFDEWWKDSTIIAGRATVLASSEDTIINGIKAKIAYMPEENGWHVHIADNQNHIYSLITEGKAADKQTFDKMLSTFKFVNAQTSIQVSTSDTAIWQTYRNEKYGFEIKYPQQYKMDGSVIKLSETKIIRVDTDFCCFPIPSSAKRESLTINGVVFEKISGTITQNGSSSGVVSYRTSRNKQNKEMQIALVEDLGAVVVGDKQGDAYDISNEPETKILDQMLSTFKLIESQAVVTKTEILARTAKDLEGQAEKVQLADGTMCVFVNGATTGNAKGERLNYQCGDVKNLSMAIYGDLTEGDVWTANVSNIEYDAAKKAWNVTSTKSVDIAKVWR